jgi:hypothetical protein
MSTPRRPRDANVTLRVDADVLMWARARAFFGGTSLNALIRSFLDEYAAVPERWRQGHPPPWTLEGQIRQVVDPVGAGLRAAGPHIDAVEFIAEAQRARQG